MQEYERVRYVTESFGSLQGLRSVLVGVVFLAAAQSQVWSSSGWSLVLLSTGLVGALVLWPLVNRYYERAFGSVRPSSSGRLHSSWPIRVVGALTFVVLASVEILVKPTVSLLAIGMALSLLALWWSERPFKNYFFIVSVLLLGVAMLPLTGLLPSERSPSFNAAMVLGLTGVIMIVGGILDHQALVRNIKPLPEEEGDGSTI